MKKLIYSMLIICIFNFFISCSPKQKKPIFDEDLIQLISENQEFPSYAFSMFFVQGENGKILKLDPRELKEIYGEDYSSCDYKTFVRQALNQELIFKTDKGFAFELDSNVESNYTSNDFEDFLKIYCENSLEKNEYRIKNNIQENQLFTVFYYAFTNNYLSEYDDPMGRYYILKTSKYLDKK